MPDCGCMRTWVSIGPLLRLRVARGCLRVCVWLGVLCCACWLLAALCGRSCVWRSCRPRDLSRAQVGTRARACVCVCVCAVVCPSPPRVFRLRPRRQPPPPAVRLRRGGRGGKEGRGGKGVDRRLFGRWFETLWLFPLFVFGSCSVGGGLICSADCSLSLFVSLLSVLLIETGDRPSEWILLRVEAVGMDSPSVVAVGVASPSVTLWTVVLWFARRCSRPVVGSRRQV